MRTVSLALLAAFLSTPALAQSPESAGGYVGGTLMMSQVEDDEGGIDFSDTPFGWKIYGGYQFGGPWAIEGGYANLGTAEDNVGGVDVEAEFSGFVVHGLGVMPLSDRFYVFGKLGLYSGETEVNAGGLSADDDDSGLAVGAGIRLNLSDALMLRGDFDWYDVDFDSLWSLGVGATYNFR